MPLSLKAPHLNFLSNFVDFNHVSIDLDLPYFSHDTSDFNESGLDVGNPYYFPEFLFIELEESVRNNPEPNTYRDDNSEDSGSQSGSSEYGTDSGDLSDMDSATDLPPTPNVSYAPVFTPFVPLGSFTASDLDVTDLILLGFL